MLIMLAEAGFPFSNFFRAVVMTVLVSAAFLNCTLEPEENLRGANETFNVQNIATNKYYQVSAEKKYEGVHCIIYIENGSGLTSADAKKIGEEYDHTIYNKITGAFGGILDVDGNGKIILLLLDIQDGYNPRSTQQSYIGGYFSPADMFKRSTYPFSNEADMLYIDIYPQVPKSEAFYSTIAHELQHLIHYSQTTGKNKRAKDTWINEGLSTAAEYLYREADPCKRIYYTLITNYPEYFDIPEGTFSQQETFFLWESHLENYNQAFLFFQWLRIHAKDGKNIYKRILDAPDGSFKAVLTAVNDSEKGIDKTSNGGADWNWQSLLRMWFASNYLYDKEFPGYKNEPLIVKEINKFENDLKKYHPNLISPVTSLITPWKGWRGQNKTVSLKNGQGVLVTYTHNFTPTSTSNITYTGIQNGTLIDTFSAPNNMPIIVFNHDSGSAGRSINAELPQPAAVPAPVSRMAGPSFEPLLKVPAGVIDAIVP